MEAEEVIFERNEVKVIRCDNTGENKKVEAMCKQKEWQLPI